MSVFEMSSEEENLKISEVIPWNEVQGLPLSPEDPSCPLDLRSYVWMGRTHENQISWDKLWVLLEGKMEPKNPKPQIKKCTWQKEPGNVNHPHEHYQIFIRFKYQRLWSQMRAWCPIWWRPAVKCDLACIRYCTKPGRTAGPWTYGQDIAPGKRSDVVNFKDAIKEGKDDLFLLEHHTGCFLRFAGLTERCRELYRPAYKSIFPWEMPNGDMLMEEKSLQKRRHHIFVSPPGFKKSKMINVLPADGDYYICPDEEVGRFDMYKNEQVIFYDDVVPRRSELFALCETRNKYAQIGARFKNVILRGGQIRYVIINVNEGHEPWYINDYAFLSRFFVHYLRDELK